MSYLVFKFIIIINHIQPCLGLVPGVNGMSLDDEGEGDEGQFDDA